MTEKVKIEMSDKDILKLVAEKFGLILDTATININHYNGDAREPSYTSIVIEGVKKS